MKTIKLTMMALMMCFVNVTKAQWVYKTVDNKIDPSYKIAYAPSTDKTALLKLEKTEDGLALYLDGGYHCDDNTTVDIALVVGKETFRYSFNAHKSNDSETVFFIDNLISEDLEIQLFLNNFKSCSKFLIRINESHCTDDYYEFLMTGSTKAVEFMTK
jgi:hypothetical protein